MSESRVLSTVGRIVGCVLLAVGVAAFAIRLQHAGPYAFPDGGNLLAAVLALLLGGWLVRDWGVARGLATPLTWLALVASPIVLFSALYATLAELEEVVVLKVTDQAGQAADLRLWIVDREDVPWVTMQSWKADAHGLREARVELLRQGELRCVIATRHEDRPTVHEIHRLRQQKYGVQRLATRLGIFARSPNETTVALRLDPCPPES
jgi:hypothetical protein